MATFWINTRGYYTRHYTHGNVECVKAVTARKFNKLSDAVLQTLAEEDKQLFAKEYWQILNRSVKNVAASNVPKEF